MLSEVRKQVDFTGGDVVKLYEQWRETRADWIERRLRSLRRFYRMSLAAKLDFIASAA